MSLKAVCQVHHTRQGPLCCTRAVLLVLGNPYHLRKWEESQAARVKHQGFSFFLFKILFIVLYVHWWCAYMSVCICEEIPISLARKKRYNFQRDLSYEGCVTGLL